MKMRCQKDTGACSKTSTDLLNVFNPLPRPHDPLVTSSHSLPQPDGY